MTTVSSAIIDKLAMTYQCDKEETEGITDIIKGCSQDKELALRYLGSWYQGRNYRHSWHLTIPNSNNSLALLQTAPSFQNGEGFYVEWNPNNLGRDGNDYLWWTLKELLLLDNFPYFMNTALVTRIDIAVDVTPMTPGAIWVEDSSLRFSNQKTGDRGELQTVYLGSRRSNKSFCIYNRDPITRNRISSDPFTMRIEARVKPRCTIYDLRNIGNPFSRLSILKAVDSIALSNASYKHGWLLDSIRQRGLQGALGLIERTETKRSYRSWLNENRLTDWFDPTNIWNSYPDAFDSLALPSKIDAGIIPETGRRLRRRRRIH